jgi:hypothetical protein
MEKAKNLPKIYKLTQWEGELDKLEKDNNSLETKMYFTPFNISNADYLLFPII